MRLIDADAICNECIEELLLPTCEGCVIKEHKLNKSIDAEPVRHGQWLVDAGTGMSFCSDCGSYAVEADTKYCSECGCKMDKESDDD